MPKKKGGKKVGKKDKTPKAPKEPSLLAKMKMDAEQEMRERFCTLQMNLMNWDFSKKSIVLKEDAKVYHIKKELIRWHGNLNDIKICKGEFSEMTEMRDENLTLREYGFVGALEGEPPISYEIYYDFKAVNYDDPLLLCLSTAPEKKRPPQVQAEQDEDNNSPSDKIEVL